MPGLVGLLARLLTELLFKAAQSPFRHMQIGMVSPCIHHLPFALHPGCFVLHAVGVGGPRGHCNCGW